MLNLPGITHLHLHGAGPVRDGYVFDPHRLALPCWAHALGARGPAVLVTLDRHFDLVAPRVVPPRGLDVAQLDRFAREQLDVRNVDHVLAAMELGLVSDAVVVARARPAGCVDGEVWVDSRGVGHRLLVAPTVDRLPAEALAAVSAAEHTLLDVDLDCFTSPSDADPTELLPWPIEVIREHVRPRSAGAFWVETLARCRGFTFAREPGHCGGLIAAGRLFELAAQVLYVELLGVDLP